MLKVLSRGLPDVREQLRVEVARAARPVLVSQEKELELGGPFDRRMPYRYLLEKGAALSMLVVADDAVAGLWRDPVGDLAEDLFDGKRAIAEAAAGYILLMDKGETDYIRRDLWDPMADVRAIAARARLAVELPPLPAPEAGRAPFKQRPHPATPDPEGTTQEPPQPESAPEPPPSAQPPTPNPFSVLGVEPGATAEKLKKAFRGLIVLYHPDKVAHLGHEFQELAERKTRELTVAYDAAQRMVEDAARETGVHEAGDPSGGESKP